MNRHFVAGTVGLVLILPGARGEDWPEFRGPTGQGLVRRGGLPLAWSASKNVTWKQPVPGKGWSTPVVFQGRVYLTTAVPAGDDPDGDQSLRALCLEGATGKLVWQTEVFRQEARTSPAIHAKNSHASPSPLTDGERLYVHFGHQGTAALGLDGKVLWRGGYKYRPVHGNGGSPVLVDGRLVFSCDGSDQQFLAALDGKTGKEVWKADRQSSAVKKFSFGTPLVIEANGRQQIVSPASDAVIAYEPRTGKEIWRARYEGYSVVPRPAFGHGLVFVSSGYDRPVLMAVGVDGRGDVTDSHVRWTTSRGAPLNPSPLLVGDELYVVADYGVASCLDARTGRVHWQERLGGNYSASPLHADGRVYFQSEEGVSTVVRAGKRFERLARNPLGERTLASYAAADGALFLRTERHLYRIEAR